MSKPLGSPAGARRCTVVSVQESWLNGSAEVQDVLVARWMAEQESRRSGQLGALWA
jgi:hypothetical protein